VITAATGGGNLVTLRPARVVLLHPNGGVGVGLGHVARCLALAAAIEASGSAARIVVPQPDLAATIAKRGGRVLVGDPIELAQEMNARAVVIDSYQFDLNRLAPLRGNGIHILAFDDECIRPLPVDIVVNGSPAAHHLPYSPGPKLLLGPTWQVVRPDLIPPASKDPAKPPQRLLVTYGGGDAGDVGTVISRLVAERIAPGHPEITITLVIGPFGAAPNLKTPGNMEIVQAPPDMPQRIAQADIAISAGGQTLYELARCGVATAAFCASANQLPNLKALAAAGAIAYAGSAEDENWGDRIYETFEQQLLVSDRRQAIARAAQLLIDGRGAERLAQVILSEEL
jgi:UDP-2,4-diacetamido-2,4,6-trideoxy-beta-L-altropyranose hydrolase